MFFSPIHVYQAVEKLRLSHRRASCPTARFLFSTPCQSIVSKRFYGINFSQAAGFCNENVSGFKTALRKCKNVICSDKPVDEVL